MALPPEMLTCAAMTLSDFPCSFILTLEFNRLRLLLSSWSHMITEELQAFEIMTAMKQVRSGCKQQVHVNVAPRSTAGEYI